MPTRSEAIRRLVRQALKLPTIDRASRKHRRTTGSSIRLGKKSPVLGGKRQDKPDPRCFKQAAKNLLALTWREISTAPGGIETAMKLCVVTITAALLMIATGQAADLTGIARIVDGDTLVIGPTHVRLEGIDSPETDQICLSASGVRWTCGIQARNQLAAHIAGREVSCTLNGSDDFKRTLGKCRLADEDLNGWMVQAGWALAYVKYSSAYRRAEEDARIHQRGLWQGAFIAPWDWRHRNNNTQILGAFSVPKDSQPLLIPRSATADAPSPECLIKGNVSRNGERIYHTPGQRFYASIRMDVGGDRRWFCTPEEAEVAGWRRAHR